MVEAFQGGLELQAPVDASGRTSWILTALLIGVVYFLIGRGSTLPDNQGLWRLAAWLASAAVAATHVGYELFRLNNSARATAMHASVAVAFGAFALAVAANIHDLGSASGYRPRMLVALVAWPVLTAVPAFIVALAAAVVLARLRTKNT
jgi:hypothetical protein